MTIKKENGKMANAIFLALQISNRKQSASILYRDYGIPRPSMGEPKFYTGGGRWTAILGLRLKTDSEDVIIWSGISIYAEELKMNGEETMVHVATDRLLAGYECLSDSLMNILKRGRSDDNSMKFSKVYIELEAG